MSERSEFRKKPVRLPILDGMRGIASLGVVLYHLPGLAGPAVPTRKFYLFVDLFFILSGFVMTLSAEPRLSKGWSTMDFMQSRLLRLWPMMALGILLNATVFTMQSTFMDVLPLAVLGLLMVPVLCADVMVYPINGPEWSVAWELLANLLHGLCLRRLSNNMLLLLCLACGVGAVWANHKAGCGCSGGDAANWYLATPRVAWCYTVGVWFARQWEKRKPRPLVNWMVALVGPSVALVSMTWLPLPSAIADSFMALLILPVLFWLTATASAPARYNRIFQWLGAISFPLYATHAAVLHAFTFAEKNWLMRGTSLLTAIMIAAAIAHRRGVMSKVLAISRACWGTVMRKPRMSTSPF